MSLKNVQRKNYSKYLIYKNNEFKNNEFKNNE
jgi:hypothetical protein